MIRRRRLWSIPVCLLNLGNETNELINRLTFFFPFHFRVCSFHFLFHFFSYFFFVQRSTINVYCRCFESHERSWMIMMIPKGSRQWLFWYIKITNSFFLFFFEIIVKANCLLNQQTTDNNNAKKKKEKQGDIHSTQWER